MDAILIHLRSLTTCAVAAIESALKDEKGSSFLRYRIGRFILETAWPALFRSKAENANPKPASVTAAPKVGRNDYCPCKSGLKYKRCCMPGAYKPAAEPAPQLS